MEGLLEWMTAAAASPWVYVVLLSLVIADAFLVILPSETVVVALGSLSLSTGSPALGMVLATAAVGAIIGDNVCYAIGARIGVDRFGWMRGPRVSAAIRYAQTALHRRPASLILTARYIPFARIAANLTAGATRFPYGRYVPLTVLAGVSWACYNCLIGALFGAWLADYPIVAVVASVIVAVSIGVTIDAVTARIAARRGPRM